eukprot:15467021-Alexandrium_andersonii.AAC.1
MPERVRKCPKLLKAASGASEHFRTLSGRFRAVSDSPLELPESARQCPKAPEIAPSSFGQYRNRLKHP